MRALLVASLLFVACNADSPAPPAFDAGVGDSAMMGDLAGCSGQVCTADQFCQAVLSGASGGDGGVPPDAMIPEVPGCQPLPTACVAQPTCACLMPYLQPNCTCMASGSTLSVTCLNP